MATVERRQAVEDRRQGSADRRRVPATLERPRADALARRVIVEHIRPNVDDGRFPIKRTVGETVTVTADIFADGHDVIVAVLRDRPTSRGNAETAEHAANARGLVSTTGTTGENPRHSLQSDAAGSASCALPRHAWHETRMAPVAPGTDEWTATFAVEGLGWHEYSIVAWVDRFETWRRDLRIKAAAKQDVSLELLEGSMLVREAAARAEQIGSTTADCEWLLAQADALADATPLDERVAAGLDEEIAGLMFVYADRRSASQSASLHVWVDRERARFGAWYEMFPRSEGPDPRRSGTFREACARLSAIADMGFDVLYLPPIHPIGRSFRKGRNNALVAGPDDPGSPWAIGSEDGGHEAIEPGLGTVEDFESFRAEAERLGLEIALDLAWQCSPDHPWVEQHPEWFRHRPDGSIKYAENPPKKYQDIYPLDFACEDWRSLWNALLEVTRLWIDRGVRIFRVDNPHTKSFGFWEWLIDQIHARDPEVIFLAEAFTRPGLMRYLAKTGFTQSYTYFTWRNTRPELEAYLTELTATDVREYLRPNLFANTPDILHEYLQRGGRAAFEARLILAATLGASYGIYSGFELCENRAVRPGSEEYLDSEKYQYRKRDWNAAGQLAELVCQVNAIRHAHPALQYDRSLRFLATDNPQLVAYYKVSPDARDVIMTVVNLDPHNMQHGFVETPIAELPPAPPRAGARPAGADDGRCIARDLLTDTPYAWRGDWNYVRLDPGVRQAHILVLTRTHA
ncbi:MAG TPA: alpha-1,4-glucan--maltose-1-phosphate maltosyltransferase [Vicinamibacterales bacterium]